MSGHRIRLITAKAMNLLAKSTDQPEHSLSLGLLPALSCSRAPQLPADSEGFNSPNSVSMLLPTATHTLKAKINLSILLSSLRCPLRGQSKD